MQHLNLPCISPPGVVLVQHLARRRQGAHARVLLPARLPREQVRVRVGVRVGVRDSLDGAQDGRGAVLVEPLHGGVDLQFGVRLRVRFRVRVGFRVRVTA